jgi:hypothetical protein
MQNTVYDTGITTASITGIYDDYLPSMLIILKMTVLYVSKTSKNISTVKKATRITILS